MTVHSARTLQAFMEVAGTTGWIEEGLISPVFAVRPEGAAELRARARQRVRDALRRRLGQRTLRARCGDRPLPDRERVAPPRAGAPAAQRSSTSTTLASAG